MAGSVILTGARTPVGKLSGALASFAATDLGGFAIKATTLRWLDATDDLEAITAGLESKAGAVQIQLVLSLTPPAAPPKVP